MTTELEDKIKNLEEQILLYREALTIIAEENDPEAIAENGQFAAEVLEKMLHSDGTLQNHIDRAVEEERLELIDVCLDMSHEDTFNLSSRMAHNNALSDLVEVIRQRGAQ